MRKNLITIVSIIFLLFGSIISFLIVRKYQNTKIPKDTPKPLLAYTFENLRNTDFPISKITFGEKMDETENYISQIFYFNVPEKPGSEKLLKVSGLANIPKVKGTYPVIVMFRGYVPKETYKPGAGSQPSARVLAKNGFITLAPDFLGYGESATQSATLFEDRFQTYVTAITLLNSISTLNESLNSIQNNISADTSKIGLWGHSNGGHIALSSLIITNKNYPTVLWAPVSKPFPYSILFYTDETDDHGKALRKALSIFEKNYDTELFSPTNYYSLIKAPIEIHQGLKDEEVLPFWTDELVNGLIENNNDLKYFRYSNADHNLLPDGWNSAVLKEIEFYKSEFNK